MSTILFVAAQLHILFKQNKSNDHNHKTLHSCLRAISTGQKNKQFDPTGGISVHLLEKCVTSSVRKRYCALELGGFHKRLHSQVGVVQFGHYADKERFFRCGRQHFRVQKTLDFSKFIWCVRRSHGKEGRDCLYLNLAKLVVTGGSLTRRPQV